MSHGPVDSLSISDGRAPIESGDHKAETTPHPVPTRDQDQTLLNPSQPLAERHDCQSIGDSETEIAGASNPTSPGHSKTNVDHKRTPTYASHLSKDLDDVGDSDRRDIESQKKDQLSKEANRSTLKGWIELIRFVTSRVHVAREPIEPRYGFSTPSFNAFYPSVSVPPAFRSIRILIILRLVSRSSCFALSFQVYCQPSLIIVLLISCFIAWILRHNRIYGLGSLQFPSPEQVWMIWKYPQ